MSFSKELCQYAIRNNALLEGGVSEAIQNIVFKAMNAHLEKRIKGLGGWKGKFELATCLCGQADRAPKAPKRYRQCRSADVLLPS